MGDVKESFSSDNEDSRVARDRKCTKLKEAGTKQIAKWTKEVEAVPIKQIVGYDVGRSEEMFHHFSDLQVDREVQAVL
jgi:hypothetical protein